MIASGGLSGGFSSTIAGGKFVDGFRQGIITSGLNHLVHRINIDLTVNKFNKEINLAFGEKADLPVYNMSQKDIDDAIKNIPTLKKIYEKLLIKFNNLKIHFRDIYREDFGKTFFNIETKTVTSISIFRSSGSSYRFMSETILHEFGHAMSGYHGFYFKNYLKYGQYSDIPRALDEIYAHKFAFHHGGINYSTPYYNKFVNFLSGNKINVNELKLPSF